MILKSGVFISLISYLLKAFLVHIFTVMSSVIAKLV